MKKIKLNGESGAGQVTYIDDDDYDRVRRYKWYILKRAAKTDYVHGWIKGKHVYLHRFILKLYDPKRRVKHLSGYGLDNCKCNLRLANKKPV